MTRAKPCPEWVKPGVIVWYHPHMISGAPRYLGMIAGEPRLLGGHTWVVMLQRMEYGYGKEGVAAASVEALRPVETP